MDVRLDDGAAFWLAGGLVLWELDAEGDVAAVVAVGDAPPPQATTASASPTAPSVAAASNLARCTRGFCHRGFTPERGSKAARLSTLRAEVVELVDTLA